jgi:hypothetical protein
MVGVLMYEKSVSAKWSAENPSVENPSVENPSASGKSVRIP